MMYDTIPKIIIHDLEYPEDTVRIKAFESHITIENTERYESNDDKQTNIRITPEKARQLATFLSDYCDKQGV